MLTIVWGLGWVSTSIERTAYPRFKRLITAHELHLSFSPSREASDATEGDERLLALLLMLKSYQRMGCFPKLEDVPDMVVDFGRRQVELPEDTLPVYQAEKTAKNRRGAVRKRVGVLDDQAEARRIVEQSIRKEAAAKNRPADLINIALEKVVEAGLELPAYSTFDAMASKIRREVNTAICDGIHDRVSPAERSGLAGLLEERDGDGTTLFNRLQRPAQGPSWSHFKRLTSRLEWVDGLGDTDVWMAGWPRGRSPSPGRRTPPTWRSCATGPSSASRWRPAWFTRRGCGSATTWPRCSASGSRRRSRSRSRSWRRPGWPGDRRGLDRQLSHRAEEHGREGPAQAARVKAAAMR
ncbi:DUF4158 domain-containing protein [Streptomyces kronopolitis]|uniref:DUF4158 domain-containing protein n=1 Tax=Streptomyces kronopolitis TaxID=1612435 RepID=UPI00368E7AC0